MATQWTKKGLVDLGGASLNLATATVKAVLATGSYTYSATDDFADDISSELSNYTRPTITVTVQYDDVADEMEAVFTDVTVTSTNSGSIITEIFYIVDNGGADSANPIFGFTDSLSQATAGSNIDLDFSTDGTFKIQRTAA